jgi:PAS domain S-box-containing protein
MTAIAGRWLLSSAMLPVAEAHWQIHWLTPMPLAALTGLAAVTTSAWWLRNRRATSRTVARLAHEQSRLLLAMVSSIGDGVIATDAQGRVTFLNRVAQELTGWTQEDAAGEPLGTVFRIQDETTGVPEENPAVRALRDGTAIGPTNRSVLFDRSGVCRAIDHSAAPIRDERGQVSGAVLVFRDVSGRREAEDALREYARLSALRADTAAELTRGDDLAAGLRGCTDALVKHLDVAFARVWTLDDAEPVLVLQASSGIYTHIDGPHRRVPVGKYKIGRIAESGQPHLTNAVPDDPWVSDRDWARREGMVAFAGYPLLAGGRVVGVLAMFARHPMSDRVLVDLAPISDTLADYVERRNAAAALRRAHQRLEDRVRERTAELASANESLKREVADRREAEEKMRAFAVELERSNKELEQFASVASHDLQEPLRKIQAFGDRLQTKFGEALGDQGRDYIDRMRGAAARMSTLINDLLAFSRVTSKAQPFVEVDLAIEARQVVSDLEARIRQAGGRVELGPLPVLYADPTQMRQLLQNLIANGLKFQRPGVPPMVRVDARPLGTRPGRPGPYAWEIRVRDNGIGFDEKYLSRLFQLFQRLHGRDQYEGTGIGLAICRKIVERHGGMITAHSAPGEGATFVATLPSNPDHQRTS